jgi:TolB-like protein/tetratricopeptide (TPR) repeat protein
MGAVAEASEDRLDSWKEIAAYLKRGVRTVRRWEHDEGLPVHRHVHHVLGSVYAYKSEIDRWQRTARRSSPARRQPSIAVLPFANLSAEPANAFFADGFTEEVTAALTGIRTLRVISRASAAALTRGPADLHGAARELGVRYILEGSVRRSEDRLRLTARLTDVSADRQLWADQYDGAVADVFSMQERLARTVVDALEIRLTADEQRRLADRPIADVHAYECYVRARHEAWRWRQDAIDHAVQLLRNGLAAIGDNARLYSALGHAYLQYREAGIDVGERPLIEAEGCAAKVMALKPGSASGLQLRGWIHYGRGRIQEAVRDLKAALAAEPGNADALLLLANCLLISGKMPEVRPIIARALEIDPLTPITQCLPAFADAMEGSLAAVVGPYRRMLDMDPGNPLARLFLVWALRLTEDAEAARTIADGFPPEVMETVPARLARFLAHEPADLPAEFARLATAQDVFPRIIAAGYAMKGMPEPALRWLAIAVDRGFINYPFLARYDRSLASLRALPAFHELMESVRQRWAAFEA